MLFLATVPLLLAAVRAAVTPTDIVNTLYAFQADAVDIKKDADQITILSGPLYAINQGPLAKTCQGLREAVNTGNVVGSHLAGTSAVTSPTDAQNIFIAYLGFAQAHVDLFRQMTHRSDVMRFVPIPDRPSVTQVLKDAKDVITAITDFLEDVVQSLADAIEAAFGPLEEAMQRVISAYTDIRIV